MISLDLYTPPEMTGLIKASDSFLMKSGKLRPRSNKIFERISPKRPGLSVPAMESLDFSMRIEIVTSITKSRLRTVTNQGLIDRLTIPLKAGKNSNKSVKFHRTYPNPIKFYQNKLICTLLFRQYNMPVLSVNDVSELQCPAFYNDISC